MTPLKLISAFAIVFLVSWLLSLIMRAQPWEQPEIKPRDLMTPEEQEALENKARLQREMHERGRRMRSKLERRMK